MRRHGTDWLCWGVHIPGPALFAFIGGGLGTAFVVLFAVALGGR